MISGTLAVLCVVRTSQPLFFESPAIMQKSGGSHIACIYEFCFDIQGVSYILIEDWRFLRYLLYRLDHHSIRA